MSYTIDSNYQIKQLLLGMRGRGHIFDKMLQSDD